MTPATTSALPAVDEAAALRSIEEALLRRFEGQIDRATVCREVDRAKAMFADARVRTFVPVLIQRTVTDTLRHRRWD